MFRQYYSSSLRFLPNITAIPRLPRVIAARASAEVASPVAGVFVPPSVLPPVVPMPLLLLLLPELLLSVAVPLSFSSMITIRILAEKTA